MVENHGNVMTREAPCNPRIDDTIHYQNHGRNCCRQGPHITQGIEGQMGSCVPKEVEPDAMVAEIDIDEVPTLCPVENVVEVATDAMHWGVLEL